LFVLACLVALGACASAQKDRGQLIFPGILDLPLAEGHWIEPSCWGEIRTSVCIATGKPSDPGDQSEVERYKAALKAQGWEDRGSGGSSLRLKRAGWPPICVQVNDGRYSLTTPEETPDWRMSVDIELEMDDPEACASNPVPVILFDADRPDDDSLELAPARGHFRDANCPGGELCFVVGLDRSRATPMEPDLLDSYAAQLEAKLWKPAGAGAESRLLRGKRSCVRIDRVLHDDGKAARIRLKEIVRIGRDADCDIATVGR
jgi:hypothetical protein